MKFKYGFLLILCVLFSRISIAQDGSDEQIKRSILNFFEGFHERDSVAIKKTISDHFILRTIFLDSSGSEVLKTTPVNTFLFSLTKIPQNKTFEEKLLSFSIHTDGLMAHAWTPYEFWYDGSLSHCGVNSFRLMKTKTGWHIISITDTRYKNQCEKQE
ncbi:nuclear transport factor 2 family protein [Flavobacteriaceae bacterium M23B6Z8]